MKEFYNKICMKKRAKLEVVYLKKLHQMHVKNFKITSQRRRSYFIRDSLAGRMLLSPLGRRSQALKIKLSIQV